MYTTTAVFNGHSCTIYRNIILATLTTKDISKNIIHCNLCSHGWWLQARSHISIRANFDLGSRVAAFSLKFSAGPLR